MKKNLLCLLFLISGLTLQAQFTAKGGVEISIYPNPATEFIQVKDQTNSATQVTIYSLVGRKLRTFEHIDGQEYALTDLPKGFYLVQVVDKNGAILVTQKLNKR